MRLFELGEIGHQRKLFCLQKKKELSDTIMVIWKTA